ncbi:hypothetical protein JI75_08395 [Berryella intestinalis]|uniref:Uncharacterized protein n=1 Tax=Berryella intestinalis TaxID=1531429 RepID=A0A0A8BBY5_9ACTN|nr:DmsC/YnfH family molybdoenzyme membrane anchor subunit [Berryella intestinalis]AJC12662.1 hypothetical protein JI75_08395 [Berryella intestinalis]
MELQWPLILFTFFVCLSSGILFVQGLLSFLGKARELQLASLVASAASLAVGGVAVFMHLEHWERIFNGFGHITSGITQELIGVVLMGVVIVLFFLMMRRSEDGSVPAGVSVAAMVVPALMVFVTGHSYNMPALPSWNTPMLEVFYLANAACLGALSVLIIAAVKKASAAFGTLSQVAFIAALAQLAAVAIYAAVIANSAGSYAQPGMYFDPTLPDVAVTVPSAVFFQMFTGDMALAFWGGSILLGCCIPAVAAFLAKRAAESGRVLSLAGIGLASVVVGTLCWRGILYVVALSVFAIF